jgi:hypothetical protein
MLEQLSRKTWSRLEPAARKLALRIKSVRPAVWIVLLVVLAIVSRESSRFYRRHGSHRSEIADAIGSIGFFYGAPQPDHSGSRVWYLRTSEKGLGLFACEVASGKLTLLKEWEQVGIRSLRGHRLLPISPDDRFLPLTISINASPGASAILEADSGKELARLEAPGLAVAEGAWMTPERLAWLSWGSSPAGTPAVFQLHLAERQPDGRWTDRSAGPPLTHANYLAGLSDDTVAWTDGSGVYTMPLASNSIATLFQPQGNRIIKMDYCRRTRQFLLTCRKDSTSSLWCLELKTNAPSDSRQLTSDKDIQSAQWINDGKGYAYLNQHMLVVRAEADANAIQLRQAAIETAVAAPTGDGLFFVGMVGQEPGLGLWRYGANALTNLVCYSASPSPHARRVQPINCVSGAGSNKLDYYLYRPANLNRHKQYPLLIGDTVFGQLAYQRDFDGPSWAEAMANCGAYVVIIGRQQWVLKDDKEWGRSVMTVFDELKGDPTLDTDKVFLYAVSAETSYVSRLLEQQPGLWQGVVLMNPGQLPALGELSAGRRFPKMLISAGKEENESARWKRFQEEACRRGVLVTVAEHPNASHVLTSIPATRDRIRAMKDFVFEE